MAADESVNREASGPGGIVTNRHESHPTEYPASNFEMGAVVTVGAAFVTGVILEQSPLNNSFLWTDWEWPWRNLGILHTSTLLLAPFSCIAYALWKIERRSDSHPSVYLWMLAASNFLLQIMGMVADPRGIGLVRQIVLSPGATSYFTDGAGIQNLAAWLRDFDHATLGFHSSTHPPGPILFYHAFFRLFGSSAGALVGGCVVGCLGSLGVLVMYGFAGLWTNNPRARMTASAFYALLPAVTVFFPEMDQAYPVLSMLLILFWCRSLESGRRTPREAVWLGVILSVTIFFAYNLLTIGAFLAYFSLYWVWRQGWTVRSLTTLLSTSAIVVGVCAGIYAALWLATGYDPIASFLHAVSMQTVNQMLLHRSYLPFALFDPYDFFLGAGMLALPLILFQLIRVLRAVDLMRREIALTLIGLATILTIDLTGVLRGETARVWLFLQPLVVVPVALELSRFTWRRRFVIFAMQWLIVVCLKAKMAFINP
jgi:hypothetical protein